MPRASASSLPNRQSPPPPPLPPRASASALLPTDKICSTCGSYHNPDYMATCSKCMKVSDHIYCMKRGLGSIHKLWHCEVCKPSNIQVPLFPKSSIRKIATSKVKFISTKEVSLLTSGSKRKLPSGHGSSIISRIPPVWSSTCSSKNQSAGSPKSGMITPKCREDKLTTVTEKATRMATSKGHVNEKEPIKADVEIQKLKSIQNIYANVSSATGSGARCNSSIQPIEAHAQEFSQLMTSCTSSIKPTETHVQEIGQLVTSEENTKTVTMSGACCSSSIQPIEAHAQEFGQLMISCTSSIQPIKAHAQEIGQHVTSEEISWKGKFEVTNGGSHFYYGIQACFPGRVAQKAYDASKRLPEKLKLELLPRQKIWPRSYTLDAPDYEDIALYFFPSTDDVRSKDDYTCLLNMVSSQDLAMRSCQDGADLLVFSSDRLMLDSQRKNDKVYLWGTFHSKKGHFPFQRSSAVMKQELVFWDAPPGFTTCNS